MNTSSHGVNLLPEKTKQKLRTLYYARLLSVVAFILAVGVAMSATLLLPSYLLARAEADAAARYLAASQQSLDLRAQSGATAMLALLSERIRILTTYLRSAAVAPVFSALSLHLPKGVVLSTIDITTAEGGRGTVSVSGKADTRDGLLSYVSALQGIALFQGVSVPVSDLAAQANVPFTLSFSFTLPKP